MLLFESKKVKHDFLDSRFEGPGEHLRFLGGMLSRDSITRMHAAIDQLLKDLDAHIQQDANLPIDEKWGIGAIFAIRPWEFPPFRELHIKEHKPLD